MAWNPSPQVAVVREAAQKMGPLLEGELDRVVLVFTTRDGRVGYTSYGDNQRNCGLARRLGDVLFETVREKAVLTEHAHDRVPLDRFNPDQIDMGRLLKDVIERAMLLQGVAEMMDGPLELRQKLFKDLVVPCVELLARFCASVNIEEE